jgi:hypothetical protein
MSFLVSFFGVLMVRNVCPAIVPMTRLLRGYSEIVSEFSQGKIYCRHG